MSWVDSQGSFGEDPLVGPQFVEIRVDLSRHMNTGRSGEISKVYVGIAYIIKDNRPTIVFCCFQFNNQQ